jgi:hypothetical protein
LLAILFGKYVIHSIIKQNFEKKKIADRWEMRKKVISRLRFRRKQISWKRYAIPEVECKHFR